MCFRQWYPRQWVQRELLVIWVWYDGCCDFAPTWGIVQIHSWVQLKCNITHANFHQCAFGLRVIYIYIYIYILCVNFDPQCVWIHVNELHSVFDFLISILKTITIRHAWSDTNYSIEVPMVRNHLVNCILMLSNLNEFLIMLWLPCNTV